MPGGGGGQQTTTQTSEPWAEQKPYLTEAFGMARDSVLAQPRQYYPNSTVVPFSNQTESALQQIENRATNGSVLTPMAGASALGTIRGDWLKANPANDYLAAIASGNRVNEATAPAREAASNLLMNPQKGVEGLDVMRGISGAGIDFGNFGRTANDIATGGVTNAALPAAQGLTGAPAIEGMDTLRRTASGANLNSDPYLDATFNRAADAVKRRLDTQFASAGRLGSGLHQAEASRDMGDLANQVYGGNYQAERARQDAAAGALADASLAGRQAQIQGTGLLGSLSASDITNRLSGAQLGGDMATRSTGMAADAAKSLAATTGTGVDRSLTGLGLLGSLSDANLGRQTQAGTVLGDTFANERKNQLTMTGLAPELAAADYNDAGMLAQVGATREELGGRQLADSINRFNYAQLEPSDRLANYMGLISGGYGTSSTMSAPLYRNTGAGILGGALGGAQLGGMLMPGVGTGVGAGLGALLGLFG